ncbi:MAG: hypothetical protein V3T05_04380, partial [Myxococcota bacterium]
MAREFKGLIEDGARIRAAGTAKKNPEKLLERGYTPKYKLQLFDTLFYLTNIRYNGHFRFFVAYVIVPDGSRRP